MDLKHLPYLPLHFFYFQLSPLARRLFFIGMGLLLGTAAIFIHAQLYPEFWVLSVSEVPELTRSSVELATLSHDYRSYPLSFHAFSSKISFSASPLGAAKFPFYFFLVIQLSAWSLVLASASLIKSKWAYLFYAVFAFFLHFSGVASLIYPGDTYHIVDFLLIASILAVAYLFQMRILNWHLGLRFVSFLSLLSLYFGIAIVSQGWTGLFSIGVNTFPVLIVLSLIFIVFISKEPSNLIVFAATNRRQKLARMHYRWILIAMVGLLFIEFVMLDRYLNWGIFSLEGRVLSPSILILIGTLFTVFTSQNLLKQAQFLVQNITTFSLLILGWALIVLSFIFLYYSQGHYVFISGIERFAAVSFMAIGLAHCFYIIFNFAPLLQRRVNLYYLLGRGPRFSMSIVWLLGLCALIIAEGSESWKSPRLFFHNFAVANADLSLEKGEKEDAKRQYAFALQLVPVGVKANYNMASLSLKRDAASINQSLEYYQKANEFYDFPYASLNAAQLLKASGQTESAIKFLRKDWQKNAKNSYLANNLGLYYWENQQPDSAILCFKAALSKKIALSAAHSNLAQLYFEYQKPAYGHKFFQAAAQSQIVSPWVASNLIAYQLRYNTSLELPRVQAEAYPYQYNLALQALKVGNKQEAYSLIQAYLLETTAPDALLLDAYFMFQEQRIEEARSRIDYMIEQLPSHSSEAASLMGKLYHTRGVPEMAAYYFKQAAAQGDTLAYLHATEQKLDQGKVDSAFKEFSALRVSYPSLWEPCSKELAMLLKAFNQGNSTFAQMEWDLSLLSLEERMRLARYADSLGNFRVALNHYQEILNDSASYLAPYQAMGKLLLAYKEPFAQTVVEDGLRIAADDSTLRLLLARSYTQQQKLDSAAQVLEAFPDSSKNLLLMQARADYALAQKDSLAAKKYLAFLLRQDPFQLEAALMLMELYIGAGQLDQAGPLILNALDYNDQNPDLWYQYARFAERMFMSEEAGLAATRAIQLSSDQRQKAEIAEEFAEQLRKLSKK